MLLRTKMDIYRYNTFFLTTKSKFLQFNFVLAFLVVKAFMLVNIISVVSQSTCQNLKSNPYLK